MSTVQDVDTFLIFLRETFIEREDRALGNSNSFVKERKVEEPEYVSQVGACCSA
jgi:hypothetical protein